MKRSQLKVAYQNSKRFLKDQDSRRLFDAVREIETLNLLSREVGYTICTNMRILDLGCGDRYLEPICIKEGFFYRGLDYIDVDFEIDPFPVQDNSIDIVISLAVIEHLRDPQNFLANILRCLKPGGLVYLSTPNFQMDWKNFYNDPTHVRPYTPQSLEQILCLAGFSSVASFPGLRCKNIGWYRGKHRFKNAFYLLPFRADTSWPVPNFLKGHARSVFGLGRKPNATA